MVSGLGGGLFKGKKDMSKYNSVTTDKAPDRNPTSPDDYYPRLLVKDKLPEPLQPFSQIFTHLWPVRAPGDEKFGKLHSPLHCMFTAPSTKSKTEGSGGY